MALGIRNLDGIAIDLWQGNPTDFVADSVVKLAGIPPHKLTEVLQTEISACHGRHIKIEIPETIPIASSVSLMRHLRTTIVEQGLAKKGTRRVTWILPTLDHYHTYQEQLFEVFPDGIGD